MNDKKIETKFNAEILISSEVTKFFIPNIETINLNVIDTRGPKLEFKTNNEFIDICNIRLPLLSNSAYQTLTTNINYFNKLEKNYPSFTYKKDSNPNQIIFSFLKKNDEVIVTPRSYIASVSCVSLLGAKPVFADVDYNSQNITAEQIRKLITKNTKAIICVHLGGMPCEMDSIMKLAKKNN